MSEREATPTTPEGKPKTFSKFKRRVSRILGKDDVKRATQGEPSSPPAAGETSATAEEAAKPQIASSKPPEAGKTPKKSAAPAKPTTTAVKPKSAMTALEHAKFQEEKVRALFAKYNQILEVGEWTPPVKTDVPRVEKKVRMRVHRTCHRCQTQYGIDKFCRNCNHEKCKKCPRYPPKKTEKVRTKDPVAAAKSEGGYVKKPITQRSRMICHECQTAFKSKSKQCENCDHQRCGQCQRAQSKGDHTAGGGANAPSSKPFVKWTCHECQNVHRDPEDPCLKCGHSRCNTCFKEVVKKAPPQTSSSTKPEEVEERMKNLNVSSPTATATT